MSKQIARRDCPDCSNYYVLGADDARLLAAALIAAADNVIELGDGSERNQGHSAELRTALGESA
jgi:hypothetical protein